MELHILFGLLLIHWVADFIFQSDWQAMNKSKNMAALVSHTLTYSCFWIIPIMACLPPGTWWFAFEFIWLCHTLTDFFTSKLTSRLFAKGDYHRGFIVVGFDQILHYAQLILTYKWLSGLYI